MLNVPDSSPAALAGYVRAGDRRSYIRAWVYSLRAEGCSVVAAYWYARNFWESYFS